MNPSGKVVLITGAASGIGAAMARRFVHEGARAVVLGDVNAAQLSVFGAELMAVAAVQAQPCEVAWLGCDVTREADIQALVNLALERFGRVDVFCSNAGLVRDGDETAPDDEWLLNWNLHVMASVWGARAVIPAMRARGSGYFIITASAAGLLSSVPSTTYAVTKHAAIAFAEKLAIDHGGAGIQVSVLCPQAVDTPLMAGRLGKGAALDGVASPDEVADHVIQGMQSGQFLILPHPQVLDYLRNKANDYDRWLGGMRKMAQRLRLAAN